ncbi:MAG: RNA methyltransferase [Clostridium sp.]|nr:RNA methyltransferase [Clostridium sp.]
MATIIELTDISDRRVDIFARLTEAQLRSRLDPAAGLFVAESPKVISVALDAGCEPVAMLTERRHIEGDAAAVIARCPAAMPLYTAPRERLASLTGYTLTRGVLCAMRRPALLSVDEVCSPGARLLAVIDGVTDTTNIGAIFRSAAALGVDGVLLTPTSCDPLNRRSVRVSMGSVFLLPWGWLEPGDPTAQLNRRGFRTAAMALTDKSVPVDDPRLAREQRLALILGTEGEGLEQRVIDHADWTVRIPMSHNVDSLNVAAASAVAFWQLRTNTFSNTIHD